MIREAKKILEKDKSFSSKDKTKFNDLLVIFKYTSKAAFEGLSQKNEKIMTEIFTEIWPLITYFLKIMSSKEETVENIIQLIKVFMRGLNKNFIKFIPEYIDCIINGYKSITISSTNLSSFNHLKASIISSLMPSGTIQMTSRSCPNCPGAILSTAATCQPSTVSSRA